MSVMKHLRQVSDRVAKRNPGSEKVHKSFMKTVKDTPQIPRDMYNRLVAGGQIRPNPSLTFVDTMKRVMKGGASSGAGMAGGAVASKLKMVRGK